ncbi:Transcriptional regulatory protein DosR [Amycolatopsis japonica]|uniref:Transcriptional regulatory protein DosR n=1 Tax=Amycolatopsis japonica TaxID=208439 RepID=A0A075UQY9_9PSEU|nr:response regulator transcription factor [Amycolatopsis japonica]AIG76612.1 Transcriptional regulatory protein DosR [Amycolatopsis japonica]
MVTKVFLVDDHEIVRRGLSDLLGSEPDIEISGEAASVSEALTRIPATETDIAVLDVRLPDGTGIELCRELLSTRTDLRCLMLTSYADDEALLTAIMAGASGFVLKQVLGNDLVSAIRTIAEGGSLLDSRTTAALMNRIRREHDRDDPIAGLSEQERAVFELIGEGLTNREIGERLFLAEKTIKNYVSRILGKLGIQRRTQAAVLANELKKEDRLRLFGDR